MAIKMRCTDIFGSCAYMLLMRGHLARFIYCFLVRQMKCLPNLAHYIGHCFGCANLLYICQLGSFLGLHAISRGPPGTHLVRYHVTHPSGWALFIRLGLPLAPPLALLPRALSRNASIRVQDAGHQSGFALIRATSCTRSLVTTSCSIT